MKTPLSELCLESIDVISGLAPRNTRLRPGANCFRTGDGDAACAHPDQPKGKDHTPRYWKEFNPLDYATREAFRRDPVKVWKWYDERRVNMAQARPTPGHLALAALEQPGRRVFIVTQNVDDLHEQAGSKEVVHIHGSLWRTRCERDGTVLENREVPLSEIPPLCMCGEIMRPDIVWFGENLPWQPVEQIHHYFLEGRIDLCLVVGTEASFGYVLQWALQAHEAGAMLVDVNPRGTGLGSIVDVHLRGKAGEVLPRLT